MNEPSYSIICWAIRLCPILFMGIAWLTGYYRSWGQGRTILITAAVGYVTGVLAVWAYWDYAGRFAPTAAIADEIFAKDGAPRVFAPFVMPVFVGVYFVMMWPITWMVTKFLPRKSTAIPAAEQDDVIKGNACQG